MKYSEVELHELFFNPIKNKNGLKSNYQVYFDKTPSDFRKIGWDEITNSFFPDKLEFAVKQLEQSMKPYAIQETGDGTIIIWSKYRKAK